MVTTEYILIGGGEHARVVLDVLLTQGKTVRALFDPKYTGALFGVPQLGEYKPTVFPDARALIAIGNNATRRKVSLTCQHTFGDAVHPSAIRSQFCSWQQGSMIMAGAIVQANVQIGKHVIINTGARVDHDCIIGDFAHIAPGVTLCGTVHVGAGTLIGAGATVIPGVKIGQWAVIGAGAVVTKDVPDYSVVVGIPSKVIRVINPTSL